MIINQKSGSPIVDNVTASQSSATLTVTDSIGKSNLIIESMYVGTSYRLSGKSVGTIFFLQGQETRMHHATEGGYYVTQPATNVTWDKTTGVVNTNDQTARFINGVTYKYITW